MLGIATHEGKMSIIREQVFMPNQNACFRCGQTVSIKTTLFIYLFKIYTL